MVYLLHLTAVVRPWPDFKRLVKNLLVPMELFLLQPPRKHVRAENGGLGSEAAASGDAMGHQAFPVSCPAPHGNDGHGPQTVLVTHGVQRLGKCFV